MNDTDKVLHAAFKVLHRTGSVSQNALERAVRESAPSITRRDIREIHRIWRMEAWNSGLSPWLQDNFIHNGDAVWIPAMFEGRWF
jgi:hypothetical protein